MERQWADTFGVTILGMCARVQTIDEQLLTVYWIPPSFLPPLNE